MQRLFLLFLLSFGRLSGFCLRSFTYGRSVFFCIKIRSYSAIFAFWLPVFFHFVSFVQRPAIPSHRHRNQAAVDRPAHHHHQPLGNCTITNRELLFDFDDSDKIRGPRCSPDRTRPRTVSPRPRNGANRARRSPKIPVSRSGATSPDADRPLPHLRPPLNHHPPLERECIVIFIVICIKI